MTPKLHTAKEVHYIILLALGEFQGNIMGNVTEGIQLIAKGLTSWWLCRHLGAGFVFKSLQMINFWCQKSTELQTLSGRI